MSEYVLLVPQAWSYHHQPMRQLFSPHHNARPDGVVPDLIVLHAISLPPGLFEQQYIEDFFLGCLDTKAHPCFEDLKNIEVSAHFVVARDGQVTQFVATSRRAWHAGLSQWQGRDGCNDFAIGIEMIGDERRAFTALQYRETARLCRQLMSHYPSISKERIVGHQDIAPDRKWDPGKQWDWLHFYRSLSQVRKLDGLIRIVHESCRANAWPRKKHD